MKVIKSHKIRLNPTPEQEQYFWHCAGVARYAWNWALAEYNRCKEAGEVAKIVGKGETLKSKFTALKKTDLPWLIEVQSYAYQKAFDDLQKAVTRYFNLKKRGELKPPLDWSGRKDKKPFGWPRFKKRNKSTPSFYLANNGGIKCDDNWAKIQKCSGLVNMTEPLRFKGKVMGARVSYSANHWWLSVQVETEHESKLGEGAVGVDLGIKYLAVTSDGEIYDNPKPLEAAQRKLRRLQRSFARMTPGGQNWHKMKAKIAKLHSRIANIRRETSHEMTTKLARNYAVIGLEDLNIKGMVRNHRMARAISDAALYEKRRQLEYKMAWSGGQVVTVSRWFPSSKTCNNCGVIKADLRLSDREWTCGNCGSVNHRDGNAALNIRDETIRILNESGLATQEDTINACGVLSNSGAMKQESITCRDNT